MEFSASRFAALLTLSCVLTMGLAGPVLAQAKVAIVFKNPGYTYSGVTTTTCAGDPSDCVNLSDVEIWSESTNQTCLMTNGNKSCKFEDVQSGGAKLFRFEWRRSISRPGQIVDVWIDVPNTPVWGQTWLYDVPAHNVVFTSDVGNRDIGMIPQSVVGERRQNSIINKWQDDVILLKGNLPGGDTPTNVAMLDGCYSIYYYADNTCPSPCCTCSRNYLDKPLCVGGATGADNSVDLSTDDTPTTYP